MKNNVISTFKEKPKTKMAWWAMGLGLSLWVILLISATDVFRPLSWGPVNIIPALLVPLLLFTCITSIIAYRKGEYSYIMWIGLVSAILFSLLFIAEFTIME